MHLFHLTDRDRLRILSHKNLLKRMSMNQLGRRCFAATIIVFAQFVGSAAHGAEDILIADFEGPTYGDWTVEGTAFGRGPAQGALPGQMAVAGFMGKGLVNSFFEGDGTTGTLTSPAFKIERHYIRFLIGGGGWENKTCIDLLVDGKVVRTAGGPNTISGGSENLALAGWDVSEFVGKLARIKIVDDATGGWGHINVDQIVQTDQKPPLMQQDVKIELTAERPWLNFPIKTNGPKRKVTLVLDGATEPSLEMELADGDVEWWAPLDISRLHGRKIQVVVDRLPADSKALQQLKQSDTLLGDVPMYHEKLRPQLHFSPRRGWNNDPNGMFFFKGDFHLFFQHNPYGWNWGNMHWGHAVTKDLVHWIEEPETLYPDRFGPMFSGSGVVDWNNTSGFGKNGEPPIVLFYTAAGNPTVQCLAYSTDHGKTFTKYDGNPVIGQITGGNRDPKVIYHEPSKKWVMVLYVEQPGQPDASNKSTPKHTIQFFTSANLKDWTRTSEIDGLFECPDLFPLPLNQNESQTKWILTAASSEYLVGSFDGKTFTPETAKLPGHRGRGFYAAQTFSDLPKSRRVQIGWLQAESPGMPFNQAMSLPLELNLTKTADGPRLRWEPVRELQKLRSKSHQHSGLKLAPKDPNPLAEVKKELLELNVDFKPNETNVVTIVVRGITIVYDGKRQELMVNNHRVAAPLQDGRQSITVFTDRTAFEIFASNGQTYVPFPVIPKPDDLTISLSIEGDAIEFPHLIAYELTSIWSTPSKH